MKLNPTALGFSLAIATAILWTVCSLIVTVVPGFAMDMTGHMMHANLGTMAWTMTVPGFVIGLVIWSVAACVTGWLIASCYNRLAATEG